MSAIRENVRIVLLVVAVVVSLGLMFGPSVGGGDGGGAADGVAGLTNLQYGLELSGGTRIRAPLVGWTAEGIQYQGDNPENVSGAVAAELSGVDARDVQMIPPESQGQDWSLEVRANVSRAAVENAVNAAGLAPSEVRRGMTRQTREEVVRTLQQKVSESGLQGGSVRTTFSVSEGQFFVVVEVPNANSSQVRELIESRGRVEVRAYHAADRDGSTAFVNRTVLTNDDFQRVGLPQQRQSGQPFVGVTVREGQTARQFQADMVETGIARQGGSSCGWPGERGPCLLIVRAGADQDVVVGSFGMQRDLAQSMLSDQWADDPQFILPTNNITEAQRLSVNLRAGELPTGLALERGTTRFVSPTFGASARTNAVIAALVAVLAVSGVVVIRYGDVRVAIPMVVTALSEVVLLLGFASGVGLALDLSHIAGFIAVIGTGVDDLIIIADEILQEGSVATGRVFQNRFRKAFWVIGAAAATTIIAMSPLMVLSLGDLTGFAIVTIVGVLLGVLVTRPAYGDVLRNLMLDRDEH